jgi:hypothetical protein
LSRMSLAGVPGTSILTLAILLLVLGIIQIGPLIVVAPLVVWSWTTIATARTGLHGNSAISGCFLRRRRKPFAAVNHYGRRLPRPARLKPFAAVFHYGAPPNRLVKERLLGLQLLAERPAWVAGHESLQAARSRRGAQGDRPCEGPCRMLEIQNGTSEIYRRVRRPALLLAGVLINRDRRVRL